MEHNASARPLILTFVGLLVLTAASWALSLAPLGDVEFPLAIGIAAVKATLVLLFFMHLIQEGTSTVLVILSGIFFVLLLASFVAAEVATRAVPSLVPPQ